VTPLTYQPNTFLKVLFEAVSTSYLLSESSQAWLVAKVVPGESQAFLLFLYGCREYRAQIPMKIDFVRMLL
jgi:hypothetical protein